MKLFKRQSLRAFGALVAAVFFLSTATVLSVAKADTFGSGENTFNIEFVTIGDPGNAADTTGVPNPAGAVPYTYRMGKFEISEQMINKANAITADAGDPLGITIDMRGPDKPATRASWFEAAQFVNWLNTSKDAAPAYKFDANGDFQLWIPSDLGYDPANKFRNTQARYFLPSADEWYKAAFYDPNNGVYFDYPTGSDTRPIPVPMGTAPGTAVYNQSSVIGPANITLAGGLSPYGTMGQGGNVWELQETDPTTLVNGQNSTFRGLRGGSLANGENFLSSSGWAIAGVFQKSGKIGFRVASIPEPTSFVLFSMGLVGVIGSPRKLAARRTNCSSFSCLQ